MTRTAKYRATLMLFTIPFEPAIFVRSAGPVSVIAPELSSSTLPFWGLLSLPSDCFSSLLMRSISGLQLFFCVACWFSLGIRYMHVSSWYQRLSLSNKEALRTSSQYGRTWQRHYTVNILQPASCRRWMANSKCITHGTGTTDWELLAIHGCWQW